jgi:hypothetical protein
MGYRGSKSELKNSVKEQRVDGSWSISKNQMLLRCTLMGFERNYQSKILSKQLNQKYYSTYTKSILTPNNTSSVELDLSEGSFYSKFDEAKRIN